MLLGLAMATPTFQIPVYVRSHLDGSYTVTTLGHDAMAIWGPELDPLLEELQLALWDKVERVHPARLLSFAHSHASTLLEVEVPLALKPLDPHAGSLTLTLTALLEELPGRRALWFPTLDARSWMDLDTDPQEHASALAKELIARLSVSERLGHRKDPAVELRTIDVEATPAKLALFFGEHAGKTELPIVYAETEDDPETPKKKKKVATPTLDRVGRPLHKMAEDERLGRAYGRAEDVQRLMRLLSAAAGPLVLIGPRGVGKSVLIDELVYALRTDNAPHALRDKEVWFADSARLIAGMGFFGQWQEQVFGVIRECIAADVVWCIGEVLPLLDAGKSAFSEQNVAQVLKPVLGGRDLRIIAESSETDWAQVELRNPGFARCFTPVRITDPSRANIRDILRAVAQEYELTIPVSATDTVLDMATRYTTGLALVGASVGLLQRATEAAQAREATRLDRFDVVQHTCDETGLPAFLVRDDIPLDLAKVDQHFRRRILGQDDVIERMTSLVARIKAGVADSERPLGSYLFIGPTGVGKTETVKALAALLFGSDERILRFDMSEYAGPDCLDRLLGAEETSGLVARVARSPFSVVLLDEVEKAHTAVFDLLLQVLGEARLTDRGGRKADFRNTVVLMTSNLGVDTFRRPTGFGASVTHALSDHLQKEVERHFRPELVNRIDAIVGFSPLGAEPIAAITDRELAKVKRREGLVSRAIDLQLDEDVPGWLAERGVDILYGARPLKRTIERALIAPIARDLSNRKHAPTRIAVSTDGDTLQFAMRDEASAAARTTAFDAILADLSLLRHRIHRWRGCTVHRAAQRKVTLIDRLARSKRFWKDEVEARRLMQEVTTHRDLIDRSTALRDQILSLEDLGFEAWAGILGEADPDELALEVDQAREDLMDFAWQLDGASHSTPHEVTLWLRPPKEDNLGLDDLTEMYVAFALMREWEVKGRANLKDATEVEFALDKIPRMVRRIIPVEGDGVRLHIKGTHAYTMLCHEVGSVQIRKRDSDSAIHIDASPGPAAEPPEPTPRKQTRRIDWNSNVFQDRSLQANRTTARLHDSLADFILDGMIARHFGPQAVKGMR